MPSHFLDISLSEQLCQLWLDDKLLFSAQVSTALNGPGEQEGSGCTPRGWHTIRARIGEGQPVNMVFRGRRPTGEVYTPDLAEKIPGKRLDINAHSLVKWAGTRQESIGKC